MTYLDAYLAIGIVCMFWFVFVEIRDESVLCDHPISATIISLSVIVFYPIWLIHRLAMWDRKNIKDKE
jgi:inner membrane protein involved in colicin E2 resistance